MNENKINSLNTIYDLMMSLYVQNVITALFFFLLVVWNNLVRVGVLFIYYYGKKNYYRSELD